MSKLPDRIYIPGEWLCIPKNHFETEDSPGATEYIRKDALLEWAKEQFASCDSSVAMKRAYDKLISKLQEL